MSEQLLAPNGKPSNLSPDLYKLVRTPQFKTWFGDWENNPQSASKVVDENGEPAIWYHYTPNNFTEFRPSWRGYSYFASTEQKALAGSLVFRLTNNPILIQVFINARNILGNKNKGTHYQSVESMSKYKPDEINKNGYDGIWVKDESGVSLAIPKPYQIKSIKNVGTFNLHSNNINESNQTSTNIVSPTIIEYTKQELFKRKARGNTNTDSILRYVIKKFNNATNMFINGSDPIKIDFEQLKSAIYTDIAKDYLKSPYQGEGFILTQADIFNVDKDTIKSYIEKMKTINEQKYNISNNPNTVLMESPDSVISTYPVLRYPYGYSFGYIEGQIEIQYGETHYEMNIDRHHDLAGRFWIREDDFIISFWDVLSQSTIIKVINDIINYSEYALDLCEDCPDIHNLNNWKIDWWWNDSIVNINQLSEKIINNFQDLLAQSPLDILNELSLNGEIKHFYYYLTALQQINSMSPIQPEKLNDESLIYSINKHVPYGWKDDYEITPNSENSYLWYRLRNELINWVQRQENMKKLGAIEIQQQHVQSPLFKQNQRVTLDFGSRLQGKQAKDAGYNKVAQWNAERRPYYERTLKEYTNIKDKPNFKQWFGNSKVIDEQGNPLVVYHGTFNKFDTFELGNNNGVYKPRNNGFYFTDNKSITDEFFGPSKNYYLSVQNPADLRRNNINSEKILKSILNSSPQLVKYLNTVVSKEDLRLYPLEAKGLLQTDEFIDAVKSCGYDGLFIWDEIGKNTFDSYIVFSPNQIKSVTNKVNFRLSSNNINEMSYEDVQKLAKPNKINENVDTIFLNKRTLGFNDSDSYPFGYSNGNLFIGKRGRLHHAMTEDYSIPYNSLTTIGRIWLNEKVISIYPQITHDAEGRDKLMSIWRQVRDMMWEQYQISMGKIDNWRLDDGFIGNSGNIPSHTKLIYINEFYHSIKESKEELNVSPNPIVINTKTMKISNIQKIGNRRFMYNPKLSILILGIDLNKKKFQGSHSEEFYDLNAPGNIDDYIKGWVGLGNSYKNGIIHFAPPITPENISEGFDTIYMFLNQGMNYNTIIRNMGKIGEQPISNVIKKSININEMSYIGINGINDTEQNQELLDNLALAKQKYAEGQPMQKIKLATGWFLAKNNNQWKYEIDSSEAKLIFNPKYWTLGDVEKWTDAKTVVRLKFVLDYPSLYKYYPQIGDIITKIIINPSHQSKQAGTIGWADNYILHIEAVGKTESDVLKTLLHEIQHAIQYVEGWAKENEKKYTNKLVYKTFNYLKSRIDRWYRDYLIALSKSQIWYDFKENNGQYWTWLRQRQMELMKLHNISFEEIDSQQYKQEIEDFLLDKFVHIYKPDIIKLVKRSKSNLNKQKRIQSYEYNKNEIESRDVEKRWNMSVGTKAATDPYSTQNVNWKFVENKISERPNKDITQTPQFKSWFGDSKVVDKRGNPLIVYHGTNSHFKIFNNFIYATADPKYAQLFAKYDEDATPSNRFGECANVMPLYMSIKNPIDLTNLGMNCGNQEFKSELAKYNIDTSDWHPKEDFLLPVYRHVWNLKKWYIGELIHKGYDGIILWEDCETSDYSTRKAISYLAFYPYQVKSAIGNNGNFDPIQNTISESKDTKYNEYKSRIESEYNFNIDEFKRVFSGGRAEKDKKEITDFDINQIIKGIKVETEHSTNVNNALEITLDHLAEFENYYDKLEKMESNLKSDKKNVVKESPDIALGHGWRENNSYCFGMKNGVFIIRDGKAHSDMEINRPFDKTCGRLWWINKSKIIISFWHKNPKKVIQNIMKKCADELFKEYGNKFPTNINEWIIDWWWDSTERTLNTIPVNENIKNLVQLFLQKTVRNIASDFNLKLTKATFYFIHAIKLYFSMYPTLASEDNLTTINDLRGEINKGLMYLNYTRKNIDESLIIKDDNNKYWNDFVLLFNAIQNWVKKRDDNQKATIQQHSLSPMLKQKQRFIPGFGSDLEAKKAKESGYNNIAQWNAERRPYYERTIRENPDTVTIKSGGSKTIPTLIRWNENNSITFGLYNNKWYTSLDLGKEITPKYRLIDKEEFGDDVESLNKLHSTLINSLDDKYGAKELESSLQLSGRAWINSWNNKSIISFWSYPNTQQQLEEITQLIDAKMKITGNQWLFDDWKHLSNKKTKLDNYNSDVSTSDYYFRQTVLFPINLYDIKMNNASIDAKTRHEPNTQHTISPISKHPEKQSDSFGSKLQQQKSKDSGYDNVAQWQAERRPYYERILKERVNSITTNPNFMNWFQGSKVVDEQGNPLVVYHGTWTHKKFDTFKTSRSKSQRIAIGAYFTNKPEQASKFSQMYGNQDARIYPVYLSIKNPIDISHIKDENLFTIAESLPLLTDLEREQIKRGFWRGGQYTILEGLDYWHNIIPRWKKSGYDGVIFYHEIEGITYVAFYPNQIKSAIGNNGNYSLDSNKLHESILKESPINTRIQNFVKSFYTRMGQILDSKSKADIEHFHDYYPEINSGSMIINFKNKIPLETLHTKVYELVLKILSIYIKQNQHVKLISKGPDTINITLDTVKVNIEIKSLINQHGIQIRISHDGS